MYNVTAVDDDDGLQRNLTPTATSSGTVNAMASFNTFKLVVRTMGPILFSLAFVFGLVGNGTLIYTILANKVMRTKSNVLIVSLAIGDFLFLLITVPDAIVVFIDSTWRLGLVFCKLSYFLQTLSMSASVLTLTALSGDRLVAIVFPLYVYKIGSMRQTVIVAVAVWLLSFGLAIPDLVNYQLQQVSAGKNETFLVCKSCAGNGCSKYAEFRVVFRFVVFFAVPMLIIAVFYSAIACTLLKTPAAHRTSNAMAKRKSTVNVRTRMSVDCSTGLTGADAIQRQLDSRRKLANVVLLFVAVFAVCWLPCHVVRLCLQFLPGAFSLSWAVFMLISNILMFTYASLNPFALYIMNDQFRRYFNHYLCGRCFPSRRLKLTDRRATVTTMMMMTSSPGSNGNDKRIHSNSAAVLLTVIDEGDERPADDGS